MSITQKKYIDITSGVGGEATLGRKSMDARLLTENDTMPTNTVMEFISAAEVGAFFGTASAEYAFAVKYFGFISKAITRAGMLSFARYTLNGAAPVIRATSSETAIALWQGITAGRVVVNMEGIAFETADIDFSGIATLADAAALVQGAIRANSGAGTLWTQANVTYENNVFKLTGGAIGDNVIDYATEPETGTDIGDMLGWTQAAMPVLSSGADAETVTGALDRITDLSNNFGSFAFLNNLTLPQMIEAAQWTDLQNVQYMYSIGVTPGNYLQVQNAVKGFDGVALTYDINNSMAEFMPMALMATTEYDRVNGVINYMYQQFPGETPAVVSTGLSDMLDAVNINYLGQTQQAGNQLAFYQRGFLQGEIADMGVYANEIWLKDALVTEWLNMFLALKQIPASESGVNRMRTAAQSVLDEAKINGTILPGKTLTQTQKAYIYEQTGDDEAWRQVYTEGYWLKPVLSQRVGPAGAVEYYLNYILIYSKGDSIRKVEGSNILI